MSGKTFVTVVNKTNAFMKLYMKFPETDIMSLILVFPGALEITVAS